MSNRVGTARSSIEVSTAPTVYPLDLAELKDHLRIVHDADDNQLRLAIKEATEQLQEDTRRYFVNHTIVERFDDWPLSEVESVVLARAPVSSVSSITYVDTDGNSQTWANSNYNVDTANEPGRIEVAWSKTVPALRRQQNTVAITYVVGYGADDTSVPQRAKRAIKLYASAVYDNRDMTPSEVFGWNSAITSLLWGM
jgi:uncharacterized phiE125 gp8 family phage protein